MHGDCKPQIIKRNGTKNWWKAVHVVDSGNLRASAAEASADLGDVPRTYIKVFDPSAVVVALHDWDAQDETEISFTKGTVVLVSSCIFTEGYD